MSRKKYQQDEYSLGGRLRSFRNSKEMNVIEFSSILNVSQGSLSAYENNKTLISTEAVINLNKNTDINIDWLLTGEGDMIRKGSVDVLEKNEKNVIELQHNDYVKEFSDKSKIKAINEALLDVERLHPAALDKIETYIKGMVEGFRMASPETRHYDNRFEERRQHDDPTKIPATGDRRLAANDK